MPQPLPHRLAVPRRRLAWHPLRHLAHNPLVPLALYPQPPRHSAPPPHPLVQALLVGHLWVVVWVVALVVAWVVALALQPLGWVACSGQAGPQQPQA